MSQHGVVIDGRSSSGGWLRRILVRGSVVAVMCGLVAGCTPATSGPGEGSPSTSTTSTPTSTTTTTEPAGPLPVTSPPKQSAPSDPVVANVGRLESVLVRAGDDNVWQMSVAGSQLSPWLNLGGPVKGEPITWLELGRQVVIVRGLSDELYEKVWTSEAGWSDWRSIMPGVRVDQPSLVHKDDGTIDVFAANLPDRSLVHLHRTVDGTYLWEPLGGQVVGTPAAVSWNAGHLDVFSRGTDDQLYHRYWNGNGGPWSAWESLGGRIGSDPVPISAAYGAINVYARGGSGDFSGYAYVPAWGWSEQKAMGSQLASPPAAKITGNHAGGIFADQALTSTTADGFVQYQLWPAAPGTLGWSPVALLGPAAIAGSTELTVPATNELEIFVRTSDHHLLRSTAVGNAFTALEDLGLYPATGFGNGSYSTSWNWGGSNHTIDTEAEWTAVEQALDGLDGDAAGVFLDGLSPTDASTLQRRHLADGEIAYNALSPVEIAEIEADAHAGDFVQRAWGIHIPNPTLASVKYRFSPQRSRQIVGAVASNTVGRVVARLICAPLVETVLGYIACGVVVRFVVGWLTRKSITSLAPGKRLEVGVLVKFTGPQLYAKVV